MVTSHYEPFPRITPLEYIPFSWKSKSVTKLDCAQFQLPLDLVTLLGERQTRRDFNTPTTIQQISSLLELICRAHTRTFRLGYEQQFRPCPSAGAIHPIHLLVQRTTNSDWERYDPIEHALIEIPDTANQAEGARISANSLIPCRNATVIAFVAEPGKTAVKYENPNTLVWRDAGVLLGYLSIIAEALSLNFCPLGLTGHSFTGSLCSEGKLLGVGMALVGGRSQW